jgi:hypothetical protein
MGNLKKMVTCDGLGDGFQKEMATCVGIKTIIKVVMDALRDP